MNHKKELVAQRVSGDTPLKTVGLNIMASPVSMMAALCSISFIEAFNGEAFFLEDPRSVMIVFGSWMVSHVAVIYHANSTALYDAEYNNKAIGKAEVKKYLTGKGRLSSMPVVGKMIDPTEILSPDAPYSYVKYGSSRNSTVKDNLSVDPMVAWDKLMEKETGFKVDSMISSMNRVPSLASTRDHTIWDEECEWDDEDEECMCSYGHFDYEVEDDM